jgi:hypothetical protein
MNISDSSIPINIKKTVNKAIKQALNCLNKSFKKKDIEKLAREIGLIKRTSSKITGSDFLAGFLASSCLGSHSTLEKMTGMVTLSNHKIQISAQALMKRINTEVSVQFLKAVHSKLLKDQLKLLPDIPAHLLAIFDKVLLEDSSSMILNEQLQEHFKGSGGRASKASVKLDVVYEWKSKKYEQIILTDQREADQILGLRIESLLTENSLVIRDLGYLRVDCLIKIIAKKAFFLSRLKVNTLIYLNKEDKQPTDIIEYFEKKFKDFNCLDLEVYITSEKLPVRLILYRAPQEVADKRRRLANETAKKQGRKPGKKSLKFMSYTVFITNVPKEIWKPEVVGTIYRIRWQIELIFKCWKSQLEIHYLKGINRERILCLLYAKLILILLANWVYTLAEFIGTVLLKRIVSMFKVFGWVRDPNRVIKLIQGTLEKWEVKSIIKTIATSMCMQKRSRKTTSQIVYEGEFYYSNGALG